MRRLRIGGLLAVVVVVVGVFGVAAAGASNGLGPLPKTDPFGSYPGSQAVISGGASVSDGSTPGSGFASGQFLKGDEADSSGNTTTTIVNFELPAGVTPVPLSEDPGCVDGLPPGLVPIPGYCAIWVPGSFIGLGDCPAPTSVNVGGNVVSFTIACDIGEGFVFAAEVDSLITTAGGYDTGVVFKVGSTRRTADDMYKIPMPDTFFIEGTSS